MNACAEAFGSNKPMVPTASAAPKELPPAFALRRHIGGPLDAAGDGPAGNGNERRSTSFERQNSAHEQRAAGSGEQSPWQEIVK